MTLDPVHVDGIAALARRISHDVDEDEHRDLAEEVWANYLDPLYDDGRAVVEPVDELARYRAPVEKLGLQDEPFESVHGLDSGTINPRTFKNGLVLDVAQAAMSASPTDMTLRRARTIVKSVHSNDASVGMDREWESFDEGHGRGRIVHVTDLARDQERVVHGLALYLAESAHALEHADRVGDFLLLDGPLYPKQIVEWADRRGGLADLVGDSDLVGEVVENYVTLVERFVERDVPVAGFVKSASAAGLVRALGDEVATPWANDMALFTQLLERRVDGDRDRSALTWTNWFVSRLGADGAFADGSLRIERALDPTAYEIAFFVVYDPRTDVAFRVELPRTFADDPDVRERVERHVLRDVAAEAGPPAAIRKADALARIDRAETDSLVDRLAAAFGCDRQRDYDDERDW